MQQKLIKGESRFQFVCYLLIAGAFAFFSSAIAHAATDRYDYDPLGRLNRYIAPDGSTIDYVYDAAGNILQVITGDTAQPPTVTGINFSSIRRGQVKQFVVTGTGLNSATVSVSDTALSISGLVTSATQLNFNLSASTSANLGPQQLTFRNAAGSTSVGLTVNPVLPVVQIAPLPIAIPPDNVSRQVTLTLTSADTIDHSFTVSSGNTSVLVVTPSSVTIPAGQISAALSVKGIAAGITAINLVSPTLGNYSAPVYVTTEFAGINSNFSSLVGVMVGQANSQPTSINVAPVASPSVGVTFGGYIKNIVPNSLAIGTGPTTLTINGDSLQGASVSINPATGLTLGTVNIASDGKSLTVPVTVQPDAPTTLRQVVVTGPLGRIKPAGADADRLSITLPMPTVTSVAPLFATAGTNSLTFVVRGTNLQGGQVTITPANDIAVGTTPTISTDGTQLTTQINLSPSASLGPRLVQVSTPGGISDSNLTAFNTFDVVTQINQSITPILSPVVGVVMQTNAQPVSNTYGAYAPLVGIALGSVVSNVTPRAGSIGQTVAVTVSGSDLQNVTAVQLLPNTGVTADTPVVASDGKSFTVNLTIASNAPVSVRTLKVLAGSVAIPFSNPFASQFQVSLPLPTIDSVAPIVVPIPSSAITFTVNGTNLLNASQIQITPSADIQIGNPPTVSTDGKSATVSLTVASSAAPGQRMVTISTPAGQSPAVATAANTVTLTSSPGATYGPIISPQVGVVIQVPPPQITQAINPVTSSLVGILLQSQPPAPSPTTIFYASPSVGVALGSVATLVAPAGLQAGSSGTLTISGYGLDTVTSVSISPNTGITIGTPQISPDGTQLTVTVDVAAGSAIGLRAIQLNEVSGTVKFTASSAGRVWIAAGQPRIDSITPILANQGDTVSLLIRGANFQGVTSVIAEPSDGLIVGSGPTVDATGTQVTVGLQVLPDAALTSHVIRVVVPGFTTTSVAAPANTFTVYPP